MSIGTAITGVVGKILSGSVQVAADYFSKRAELKSKERIRKEEVKDAIHQRRCDLISKGLAADSTWELEQIKNSGWKDEYVLIILSIPSILSFIKLGTFDGAAIVAAGFAALESTPEWYRWVTMMIFLAVYGIRLWRRQQYDTE